MRLFSGVPLKGIAFLYRESWRLTLNQGWAWDHAYSIHPEHKQGRWLLCQVSNLVGNRVIGSQKKMVPLHNA